MKQFENLKPPEKEFIPFSRNFELEKEGEFTIFLTGQLHFKNEEEKEVEIHLYEELGSVESSYIHDQPYFKTSSPTHEQISIFQSMIDEIEITDDSDYYKCE